jgi:hypothetical protein
MEIWRLEDIMIVHITGEEVRENQKEWVFR